MLHIKMDSGDILQCSKNHASSVQSSAKFCIRWRNVDIPDGFDQFIDGVVGNVGIIQQPFHQSMDKKGNIADHEPIKKQEKSNWGYGWL